MGRREQENRKRKGAAKSCQSLDTIQWVSKVPGQELVVSKTKHSKTKTEARSTQISKTKHPKLENEAPKSRKRSTLSRKRSTQKTRHRSVLYKHETNVNTAEIKRDNEYSITNRMQFKSTQVVNAFPPLRGRPGGRLCFGRDQIPTIEPDPRLLP